uniref:TIGR04084 family radical SAM/SPASM domain-containing protein n=1 Tax=Methanochimaera problematica TaxID=2609417 RepID=UPI0038CD9DE5
MNCSYCRGKIFEVPDFDFQSIDIDETLPCEASFNPGTLYSFLSKDEEAVLTFYGGEPLLRDDLIKEMMDNAPVKDFMIHTNGTLLNLLPSSYINRFRSIFVSIDGNRSLTDMCRGAGTYERIINNLVDISKNGYKGEIIGRMTVTENTDIYESVRFLSSNDDFSFSSIHWQIDGNFWNDYSLRENFSRWVHDTYNPGISMLIRYWVNVMEEEGRVLMWYPFVGTMGDLLSGYKKSPLRCGSGFANYSIMQDGSIAPCPCMAGMKDHYCGHIDTSSPCTAKKECISGECLKCDILDFCGGRCLYSNITRPWPDEGRRAVYETVKNLKNCIESELPRVKGLIEEGVVSPESFEYIKYNGCEIIP